MTNKKPVTPAAHDRLYFLTIFFLLGVLGIPGFCQQLPVLELSKTNSTHLLRWLPYPGTEGYRIMTSQEFKDRHPADGTLDGFQFLTTNEASRGFYWLEIQPIEEKRILTGIVLNRLAYGPTPDELERILWASNAIGPEAYIAEQLQPELIEETIDIDSDPNGTNWYYVTVTGTATSPDLFIYTSRAGSVFIDDIKLVAGIVPEEGPNLIANGDFEAPLSNGWITAGNLTNSRVTTETSRSGISSLEILATGAGSANGNSVSQRFAPSINRTNLYTLSYWYRPASDTDDATFVVRLGGNVLSTRQLLGYPPTPGKLFTLLTNKTAQLTELRAWFVQHAISSKRQLLEVLTQFLDNHFVTQHSKITTFLDQYYNEQSITKDRLATELEFRELSKWREALLNPDCTFHELLKISAESPTMIIYLDTVTSRGDGDFVANENYARELFELFCNGVDNGYDQKDIEEMSRVWTGWSVDIHAPEDVDNPHAPTSTILLPGVVNNAKSNLFGLWTFKYRPERHDNREKVIFAGKKIPARFGEPWVNRNYELRIPPRTGTNGIQDGYQVLAHLANLPFTQEYLSVKLCRLFVHDQFEHGYDFSAPNLTPEATLIRNCMLAWENSGGKIRAVLRVIFDSELFRSRNSMQQKVKTPLEFAVSTVRALRGNLGNGSYSAHSDGYSIAGRSRSAGIASLTRMGGMLLFDRVDPDGYPERGDGWISAGVLAERLRYIQTTLMAPNDTSKTDSLPLFNFNFADPMALVKNRLPESAWRDPGALADYFLLLFFPSEGKANLVFYRNLAIHFLNTADNGTVSDFSTLLPGTPAYDTRLRGMVSMLLTMPRFQEQ